MQRAELLSHYGLFVTVDVSTIAGNLLLSD